MNLNLFFFELNSTEANTAAPDSEEPRTDWKGGGGGNVRTDSIATPQSATNDSNAIISSNNNTMHNPGKVKFEPPKVPVIFVLGGPGSGKVTHCDTLMQEKKGITHINMMDLLQQYAIGNGKNKPYKYLKNTNELNNL